MAVLSPEEQEAKLVEARATVAEKIEALGEQYHADIGKASGDDRKKVISNYESAVQAAYDEYNTAVVAAAMDQQEAQILQQTVTSNAKVDELSSKVDKLADMMAQFLQSQQPKTTPPTAPAPAPAPAPTPAPASGTGGASSAPTPASGTDGS